MVKKTGLGIGILLIGIALIAVVAVGAYWIFNGSDLPGGSKKVSCEVGIDGDYFSDTDIVSASCNYVGICPVGFSVWNPWSWGRDKGVVKFVGSDSLTYAQVDYTAYSSIIPGAGTREYVLTGCTDVTSGKIVVVSDSGEVQDRRSVTIT